jgi:energy-coupling factor transport system substrate-specific component
MKQLNLSLIPLGIALNIILGGIMQALKVPFYMDAVGTILITLLAGWRLGMIVGVGSFMLGGLLTNPVLPWFSGTQIVIAGVVYQLAKYKFLDSLSKQIVSGVIIGIVAAVASAPIIAYLFGGITGSGPSVIASYFLATGQSIIKSVIYSGISVEPIDKTLQLLLAIWLLKGIPKRLLSKFDDSLLKLNGFIK